MIESEHEKRHPESEKVKHRIQNVYPLFLGLSVLLVLLGQRSSPNSAGPLLFIIATSIQGLYLLIYDRTVRKRRLPSRYPSTLYSRLQTYLFTLVQTLHNYSATTDILRPSEVNLAMKAEKLHL